MNLTKIAPKRGLDSSLLLFSLFGIAMWFFGNLYEGIVIAPNLLTDPVGKVHDWQKFFTLTNPIFYYLPMAPLVALTTFIVYFKTAKGTAALKRRLGYAAVFLIFALGAGIFTIAKINLRLFFGNIEGFSAERVYTLSVLWNLLNMARIILLALTIYHLFNAYILKLKT